MGLFGGGGGGNNYPAMMFLQQGRDAAIGSLGRNFDRARAEFGRNYLDPYTQTGDLANNAYADALGLFGGGGGGGYGNGGYGNNMDVRGPDNFGGPGGNGYGYGNNMDVRGPDNFGPGGPGQGQNNAVNRFRATPGYRYALDQGNENVLRNAAAQGTLAGGGTSADLLRLGQGMADQEYNTYLDRLKGLSGQGFQAGQAQTGRQGTLAGISTQQGIGEAGVFQNAADAMAKQYGQGLARQDANDQAGQRNLFGLLGGGLNLGLKAFLPGLA